MSSMSTRSCLRIHRALQTPGLRDFLGAVDAAVDAHLGLVMGMAERGAVLDALMKEYERGARAAMEAAGRTFGEES